MNDTELLNVLLVSLAAAICTTAVICIVYVPAVMWIDRLDKKKLRGG